MNDFNNDGQDQKRQRKARRAQTHNSLAALWDDVVSLCDPLHSHHELGYVGKLAEQINRLLNWDVQEDDVIGIQGDDVRHILKRHGAPYKDKRGRLFGEFRPDHVPITKNDFVQLPLVFDSPQLEIDDDPKWGKVLILKKHIQQQQLLAITIHASSKKMLHILSMRKTK